MLPTIDLLKLTVTALAATLEGHFVTVTGASPSAGGHALGVAYMDADAGQEVSVSVIGTVAAVADAAIPIDSLVQVTATGKVVAHTSGVAVGRSLTAASAAGDEIELLLIAN